ncbi:MAG: hypothetical protein HZB51_14980 [Chloroflexi bacterium]|nr:hypothetical protein [Chloroflexota bacterium]
MKIPIFVSRPTTLNPNQEAAYKIICAEFDRFGMEERRLGGSDYPTELPLKEVLVLARHCAGGVILGFEQLYIQSGTRKRGTPKEQVIEKAFPIPTGWNHLEAGILFGLQLPLLVFKEDGIGDGVFDPGVTDAFVHRMPRPDMLDDDRYALSSVFMKWQAKVREHYYR